MDKRIYENLKEIRKRIDEGKPTTFAERNIIKIVDKKRQRKSLSK